MLAVDLDGTLLTHERVPHAENILAIQRALQAGIKVVPASGRIASSIKQFSEELGLDGAMICSNGSHVVGLEGAELLYVGLSPVAIDITLDYAQRSGVHTSGYTRHELYFLSDSDWGDVYRRRVRSVIPQRATFEDVRKMSLLKIILIDGPGNIPNHRRALEAVLPQQVAALTESEPEYLEILSPHANKGLGLKVLSESLGIPQEETAAIGDYLNDVEMVRWAGIGAAVANADYEVRAAADVQVGTNDEAGVAQFIDYLIARNRSGL